MQLGQLVEYLQEMLEVSRFRDYCPNGLQVEGRPEVKRIVTGVSASVELLEAARERGADAVIVHHGWFWKNEDPRVVGLKRKRLNLLLANGISLLGYHLPLDAHPEVGNNAQLARRLGLIEQGRFGEQSLGCHGIADTPLTVADIATRVRDRLGREPLVIGDPATPVDRVAWCTGAAQSYFPEAVDLGVSAFITGEISEQYVHLARESGVAFVSAGHHATERYGVQALGEHLAARFGLAHEFVEIPNPV